MTGARSLHPSGTVALRAGDHLVIATATERAAAIHALNKPAGASSS